MARQKKGIHGYRKSFTYNGKRYDVYAQTTQELEEKVAKKRDELEKGLKDVYNPTLNAYYEHFNDVRRRSVKGNTIRGQHYGFNNISSVNFANELTFGDMRIKDITRRDIEKAREILIKNGKKPQSINVWFTHLNNVFNCAVMDETIDKNPCRALKQLKRDTPVITDTKHRALSEEETKKFFEVAKKRESYFYNHFLVMVKTGLRIGELCALNSGDIDRKNGFIHIKRTLTKNENGDVIIGEDAKTTSGARDIPLTEELSGIIKEQEKQNRVLFGLEVNGIIFKSRRGNLLREYTINREIERICKEADIEAFTCHAFRDTFATRFIEQRPQDYKILSEILGHSDISITLNLYTHVMTENKVKAMDEIQIKTS